MIYERFIVIFICSVLSSLTTNSSRATELTVLKSNFIPDTVTSQANHHSAIAQARINAEYNYQNYQVARSPQSSQQVEASDDSDNSEAFPIINRRLFLAGMAITSAISLYLVWLLFRTPTQNSPAITRSTAVKKPKYFIINFKNKSKRAQDVQGEPRKIAPSQSYFRLDSNAIEEPVSLEDIKQVSPIFNAVDSENFQVDRGRTEPQPDSLVKDISMIDNLAAFNSLTKINSNFNHIDVVLELIQDLQQSDRHLRRKAIWELAKIGDLRSIQPLVKIISQADSIDKSLILKAVTQITNRNFQPINTELFALLQAKSPEVRINAIRDLTTLYKKFLAPVTKQLAQMQLDSDRQVRQTATQALQQLNSDSSLSMLDDYFNNGNHNLASGEEKSQTNHI
ncbi:MAG TPA: HEAT repeat domain-containing protein [Coleofasciculaceae cyanobacterium]|jgi:hypothetical protein